VPVTTVVLVIVGVQVRLSDTLLVIVGQQAPPTLLFFNPLLQPSSSTLFFYPLLLPSSPTLFSTTATVL
jgi:hypothetical protein